VSLSPLCSVESSVKSCDRELLAELARQAFDRCGEAAEYSENPGEVTRTFCSPAMARLHGALRGWMESAGMKCRLDAAGNLLGRWDTSTVPDAAALIVGSHLDTVPNGGRYDGMLGVLLGVALVTAIARSGTRLPFALEVVGFSEEEGVRFGTPFIGSRALIGDCDQVLLDRADAAGISVRAALESFGCNPKNMTTAEMHSAQVVGFLEAHIEQGPMLQDHRLPLGVVTAIAGQTRARVRFLGTAGHAGTVPMQSRRDALAAAAEWISNVETVGRDTGGLVATVGAVEVIPGAVNVIPGEVRVSLDIRHADDAVRTAAFDQLQHFGNELAARRNVKIEISIAHEHRATAMDKALTDLLHQSIKDTGVASTQLVSGAGHDAAVMARRFPAAMLFIRCRDGISHHPDESVMVEDITAALTAMWHFVQRLAQATTKSPSSREGT
jgi:allantoate deiminase